MHARLLVMGKIGTLRIRPQAKRGMKGCGAWGRTTRYLVGHLTWIGAAREDL